MTHLALVSTNGPIHSSFMKVREGQNEQGDLVRDDVTTGLKSKPPRTAQSSCSPFSWPTDPKCDPSDVGNCTVVPTCCSLQASTSRVPSAKPLWQTSGCVFNGSLYVNMRGYLAMCEFEGYSCWCASGHGGIKPASSNNLAWLDIYLTYLIPYLIINQKYF